MSWLLPSPAYMKAQAPISNKMEGIRNHRPARLFVQALRSATTQALQRIDKPRKYPLPRHEGHCPAIKALTTGKPGATGFRIIV